MSKRIKIPVTMLTRYLFKDGAVVMRPMQAVFGLLILLSGAASFGIVASGDHTPGRIQVTSYIHYSDTNLVRIGNTEVHVQAPPHATTDTAHNCSDYNKTTNTDSSSAGYGQAHFINCWVGPSDTLIHSYRFSLVNVPAGYTFESIHDITAGHASLGANTTKSTPFPVRSNQETSIAVWMKPVVTGGGSTGGGSTGGSTGGGSTGGGGGGPPAAPGSVKLQSFVYGTNGQKTPIGNTKVTIYATGFSQTNTNEGCADGNVATTNQSHTTGVYGQAHFTRCWSGSQGTKQYRFYSIEVPSGYSFRSIHGSLSAGSTGAINSTFNVNASAETPIEVWLNPTPPPPPQPVPPGTTPATSSVPVGSGGAIHQIVLGPKPVLARPASSRPPSAPRAPARPPAAARAPVASKPSKDPGSVHITVYARSGDGTLDRLGGAKVAVRAVGFTAGDSAHNCSPNSGTTNTSSADKLIYKKHQNGSYAQLDLEKCWTGSDGRKAYTLAGIPTAPYQYSFRSVHGELRTGSSNDQNAQFDVTPGHATNIDVWMNDPAGLSKSGEEGDIGEEGDVPLDACVDDPNDPDPASSCICLGETDIEPATVPACNDPVTGGNETPPTAPANLSARAGAGATVTLTWDAAKSSADEGLTDYQILRSISATNWADADSVTTENGNVLKYIDQGDVMGDRALPNTHYYYRVIAEDANGESPPAQAETITLDGIPNVGAGSEDTTGDQEVTESPDATAPDADATSLADATAEIELIIPDDPVIGDMSCAVVPSGSSSPETIEEYQMSCVDNEGNTVDDLASGSDFSVVLPEEQVDDSTVLAVQDDEGNWVEEPTTQTTEKGKTKLTISTNPSGKVAVMASRRNPAKAFTIAAIVGLAGIGLLLLAVRLIRLLVLERPLQQAMKAPPMASASTYAPTSPKRGPPRE